MTASSMTVDIKSVTQVYSGKPGCACGCRGTHYRPGDPGFDRMAKKVLARLASPQEGDERLDGKEFLSVENERRLYVVYFKSTATPSTTAGV